MCDIAKMFIELKKNRKYLTAQQYMTIKGQIISGNIDGAIKGMNKLIKKYGDTT